MSAEYSKYSPYYTTDKFGNFLDVLNYRPIPRSSQDILFKINKFYEYRPDLLANDMYGRSSLWWVFVARNPNTLQDPIWDFKVGQKIFIPDVKILMTSLGI
jgi:hypothetical protein